MASSAADVFHVFSFRGKHLEVMPFGLASMRDDNHPESGDKNIVHDDSFGYYAPKMNHMTFSSFKAFYFTSFRQFNAN